MSKSNEGTSSTVTYRHDNSMSYKKNGEKHVLKENLIDGEKGLSFHYLKKEGEKKFFSISVKELSQDRYSVKTKDGDKLDEKEMNMSDLAKVIKSNPGLKYVDNFLSKDRSVYKGRKVARKTARKTQRGGDCGQDEPHIVGGAKRRRSKKAASKKGSRKSRKGSKKSRKSRRRRKSAKGGHQNGGNPLEDLVGGRRRRSKKAASKKGSKKSRKSRKGSKKSRKSRRRRKSAKGGDRKSVV